MTPYRLIATSYARCLVKSSSGAAKAYASHTTLSPLLCGVCRLLLYCYLHALKILCFYEPGTQAHPKCVPTSNAEVDVAITA